MNIGKTLTFKVDKYQILEEDRLDRFYNPVKAKIIKVHFSELVKHGNEEYSGIYLPFNLIEQTASSPSDWLTDDNVAFILKNQDYETNVTKDGAENIYLGNKIGVRIDLTYLNYLNELAKKAEMSRANSEETKQLQELAQQIKSEITKYTILPLALGKHPQNHWGTLILEKGVRKGKTEPNISKVYWTSSKNSLEEEVSQIKALVSFITNKEIANNIDITTLDGEKQEREEDSGIYLCLYIKEILEYETRISKAVGEVLALTRNYNIYGTTVPKESKTVNEWCDLGQISEDEKWELLGDLGIYANGKYTLKELKEKLTEIALSSKPRSEELNQSKTLKEWLDSENLTSRQYELLLKGYEEKVEDELYFEEVQLDPNYLYSWGEIYNHLQKAQAWNKKEQELAEKMNDGEDWKNIHSDFKEEWEGKQNKTKWIEAGFNYSQTKEWIDIGIKPDEDNANFCAWMRDRKKMTPDYVLNNENIEKLREEYKNTFTEYE